MKVLLTDDSLTMRKIQKRVLTEMGISEVTEAIHGIDALRLLKEHNYEFDFILLDINMPEMNGWEFVNEFAKLKISTQVIMLTSSIDQRDEEKARSFPEVKGYFTKPLDNSKIEEILGVN